MFNDNNSAASHPEPPLSCVTTRQVLADLGLSEARRREIAEGLSHLEGCEACREAIGDYDRIQVALTASGSDGSEGEPRDGWVAFEERLHSSLPRLALKSQATRFLRPLVSVAAAMLLAVGGFFWGGLRERTTARLAGEGPSVVTVSISRSDVARQMRAFGEVDQVFEGHTRWLLLTGGATDVSLDDAVTKSIITGSKKGTVQIVLLRLDLLRDGHMESTADLVIVAGKTAEIRLPMKNGTSLRYRVVTSGADPSQLGLRAELCSGGGAEAQASLATELQLQPDHGTNAGQLIAPSGRYDVKVLYASASNEGPEFQR